MDYDHKSESLDAKYERNTSRFIWSLVVLLVLLGTALYCGFHLWGSGEAVGPDTTQRQELPGADDEATETEEPADETAP